ncbi:MAG TPA: murein biosynthesis integral membrane protein MurJ [Abditibacteriaceae bacterium]|jgi:putative peptidoglycan lipid II flippase
MKTADKAKTSAGSETDGKKTESDAATGSTPSTTRRIEISQGMTVGRASLLMAAMVALSRLTGFGRIMLTSYLYGRNATTDAYNAAFNIPDTISILIAGGALATGFVPVFTAFLSRGEEDAARRTFRAMLTLLGAAFGLLTLLLFALTFTPIGRAVALSQVRPDKVDLYFYLLRILLVGQFFFVLGGLFTGTLNALRLFWFAALQPVVFNLGIIAFGIVLPQFGMGIESQAWGALVGALIGSIFIQIPAVRRSGLSLLPLWDLRDEGVQRVLKSLLPIVFGLASGQIIALNLPRFLAGGLGEGDLTAIDNANRLMQLPLAIFASGPAIALYPTLSLLAAEGKMVELRDQIAAALRRTLLLTMLATALLIALREPIVRLLLEHGKFTRADTEATTNVLLWYSLGIVGLSAQQMLARGFYARSDTKPPIYMGLAAMAIFCAMGIIMTRSEQGASGLALAASVALSVLGVWMWFSLRSRLGGWDDGATISVLWKGTLAAGASYAAAVVVVHITTVLVAQNGFDSASTPALIKYAARLGVLALGTIAGAGTFLIAAKILRLALRGASATGDNHAEPPSRIFTEYRVPSREVKPVNDHVAARVQSTTKSKEPARALDE